MATRLYFRSQTDSTSGLPTAEQSSISALKNMEGSQTTNRQMTTAIGSSQTGITDTVVNETAHNLYFTRFVSPALSVSSIAANTWTYNFSTEQSNALGNFPVVTSGSVRAVCYVWRPSSSTKIGTIRDGTTTSGDVNEPAASTQKAHHTTFTGAEVLSVSAGDVIIFEVWFTVDPAVGGGSTVVSFYYAGNTANTTKDATVSNHASFIETPQDDLFAPSTMAMTETAAKTYSNKFITKV